MFNFNKHPSRKMALYLLTTGRFTKENNRSKDFTHEDAHFKLSMVEKNKEPPKVPLIKNNFMNHFKITTIAMRKYTQGLE